MASQGQGVLTNGVIYKDDHCAGFVCWFRREAPQILSHFIYSCSVLLALLTGLQVSVSFDLMGVCVSSVGYVV